MSDEKSKRRWYRWRWLPLLVAILSVGGGLLAYLRMNPIIVDTIEVRTFDVNATNTP